jgi:hypothetical protein
LGPFSYEVGAVRLLSRVRRWTREQLIYMMRSELAGLGIAIPVVIANTMARIAWTIMARGGVFERGHAPLLAATAI